MAIINRAVVEISLLPQLSLLGVSKPFFSEPWGFESPNRFTNVGVVFETSLEPFALLEHLQQIEKKLTNGASHRNADGSYRDRQLDIDIITFGELRIDTPRLTIPHPRMRDRDFVMIPMMELDSSL